MFAVIKTILCIRQYFFSLQIANLQTSLPENVIEAPTTEMFKNRFDRQCRETNLLFDVDIDMVAAPLPNFRGEGAPKNFRPK